MAQQGGLQSSPGNNQPPQNGGGQPAVPPANGNGGGNGNSAGNNNPPTAQAPKSRSILLNPTLWKSLGAITAFSLAAVWIGATRLKQKNEQAHAHDDYSSRGKIESTSSTIEYFTKEAIVDTHDVGAGILDWAARSYSKITGKDYPSQDNQKITVEVPPALVFAGWNDPKPGSTMWDFKTEVVEKLRIAVHSRTVLSDHVLVSTQAYAAFCEGKRTLDTFIWVRDSTPVRPENQIDHISAVRKLPAPELP